MQSKSIAVALLSLACIWAGAAVAQSTEERARLKAMDQQCHDARAAKLRVLQQEKVEECLKEPPPARSAKKTREQCERYWRDYGWGAKTGKGRAPRFYTDLPECNAAFEARKTAGSR